jgi:hypothetical protein
MGGDDAEELQAGVLAFAVSPSVFCIWTLL